MVSVQELLTELDDEAVAPVLLHDHLLAEVTCA